MTTPRDRLEARLGLAGPPLQPVRDTPPRIPDHDLIRRIGQGAYGEVWLARNALGTWRAVKIVFRDNFKDARPYEREFAGIRRFEPLSRSNEGFVDVLQVGRDDAGGWFYYVMELADCVDNPKPEIRAPKEIPSPKSEDSSAGGEARAPDFGLPSDLDPRNSDLYQPRTLARDLHHRGRLPLEDCLELGLTLTLALGHLHRHGLIHRDVKPSNIIYVGGVPKLADIGLVTEAQGANTFVGTEGFVPPEGPTSPQADLYALGKVLYEAAMGKDRNEFPEPFTQIGTDRESIALMELNAVLLRACAPDPKKRYASAEEMHADLALLHSGGSVKRRHQFDRQFQIAKQVGAVAMSATLLIGAALLWQRQQTQKMTRLAGEKSALADHLSRIGETNRESLVRLSVANGVRLLEDDPAGALLWLANALPLVTNNPVEETIHRIRIQQALDETPRLRRVFSHESSLNCGAFSPDGRLVMSVTQNGNVRVWNKADGTLKWGPIMLEAPASFGRFTRDGKRILLSFLTDQGTFTGSYTPTISLFEILDAETGKQWIWPSNAFEGAREGMLGAYFSPDDRWLATAHSDGTVRLFDMTTGRFFAELRGHTNRVLSVSFSADGKLLASASADRTVRLWELPSAEPFGDPFEHKWSVVRVLFSENGQRLITVGWESEGTYGRAEVNIWNVSSRQKVGRAIEARDRIAVFLGPGENGSLFLQDRPPNALRAYKPDSGKETPFDPKVNGVRSWDFTKDGSRVVLGRGDRAAEVRDAHNGNLIMKPLRAGRWGVNTVQFSPDGSELLTAGEDGNLRLWHLSPQQSEVVKGRVPDGLKPGFTFRQQQEFGRTGNLFPVRAGGRSTAIFDDQLRLVHRFKPNRPDRDVLGVGRSPDGKYWAVSVVDGPALNVGELRLGILKGNTVQEVELPHPANVKDEAFNPDSQYLISACEDRQIRFWRTSDGSLERTVKVPGVNRGEFLAIAPDGRTALWRESRSNQEDLLRFFDFASGTFIGEPYQIPSSFFFFYMVFSPNGQFLALLDQLGSVNIVENRTGRLVSSRIRHPGNLTGLHWELDNHRLLTTGDNDEVCLWDIRSDSRPLRSLRTPNSNTRTARWSPDARFIVGVGGDNKVRVWDADNGEIVAAFQHANLVAAAAILGSNRLISVSYTEEELRVWDLKEIGLSADVLIDYAQYLSGCRLDSSRTMIPLTPEELSELDRSLRQRAPNLFN